MKDTDPPKVALMLRSLSGGGMERIVTTLANGFAERGCDVILLAGTARGEMRCKLSARVRLASLTDDGISVRIDPTSKRLGPAPRMLLYLPALVDRPSRPRAASGRRRRRPARSARHPGERVVDKADHPWLADATATPLMLANAIASVLDRCTLTVTTTATGTAARRRDQRAARFAGVEVESRISGLERRRYEARAGAATITHKPRYRRRIGSRAILGSSATRCNER